MTAKKTVRTAITIGAVAMAVAAAEVAAAEPGGTVVAVAGSVEDGDRSRIEKAAIAELNELGTGVLAEPAAEREAGALAECARAGRPCTKTLARLTGAARALLLVAEPEVDEGKPIVVLTGYLVSRDGVVSTDRRYCMDCGHEVLEQLTKELVAAVVRGIDAPSWAVLRVRTEPPGARVLVDNEPVGVSNGDFPVPPGRHRIGLDKRGHEIAAFEIDAPAGSTQVIDTKLVPTVDSNKKNVGHQRRRHSPLVWLAGAAGLSVLGAGVTLMVLDGPEVADGDRQYEHRNSMLPGVVLSAAGVVSIGAAIYLWWRAPKSSSPQPVISIDGGGAHLGVAGRF